MAESNTLVNARISGLPPCFYYIPNFITEEEEAQILQKISSNRWTTLRHRRLQTWPSRLHEKTNTLLLPPYPLPEWLTTPIVTRFEQLGVFMDTTHRAPNHVLINEYRPGEGIMPHEDGGAYNPVVATVSFGRTIVLDLYSKDLEERKKQDGRPLHRILQEPRSLLVTTGEAYTALLHGIQGVTEDKDLNPDTIINWGLLGEPEKYAAGTSVRGVRTSFTYRDVLKVSHGAKNILGLGRR